MKTPKTDPAQPVALPRLVRRLIAQQQRMYDALRRIARDYRKADSILSRPEMGLDGDENLAMAYDNIQSEAAAAIKGVRRAAPNDLAQAAPTTTQPDTTDGQ